MVLLNHQRTSKILTFKNKSMSEVKLDKVYAVLDKLKTSEDISAAYQNIKDFLTKKLTTLQQDAQEKASNIQNQLEKINGN